MTVGFIQGITFAVAARHVAFQCPDRPGVQFDRLLTVFLNANGGSGGISSVIDGVGRSSTTVYSDIPVDVVSYP